MLTHGMNFSQVATPEIVSAHDDRGTIVLAVIEEETIADLLEATGLCLSTFDGALTLLELLILSDVR